MDEPVHNPYAPPTAAVERVHDALPPARKPFSAWLLQLLALAALGLCLLGLWRVARYVLLIMSMEGGAMRVFIAFAWRGVAIAAAAGALVGTQRRAAYGRWLGLLLIGGVVVLLFYVQFVAPVRSGGALPSALTPAERGGEAVGAMLVIAASIWWFHAFGFSAKARRYFQVVRKADATGP